MGRPWTAPAVAGAAVRAATVRWSPAAGCRLLAAELWQAATVVMAGTAAAAFTVVVAVAEVVAPAGLGSITSARIIRWST
jgi:hypothetical protein